MLIKEFRVVMPVTVEEYQIGQLYSVAEAGMAETGGGEGIEVVKNEPFDNVPLLGGKYRRGQYTYKKYHLASKVPAFIRMLAPRGAMEIHEEAWNAYPYCKTVISNPGYMKENFFIIIESLHLPDKGDKPNVHELPPDKLKHRKVIMVDIANDPVSHNDYKVTKDPQKFKSSKTGRGPLNGKWAVTTTPVMTCYKLVTVEFKWFGLQNRVESFIQKAERRLFTNFHRQVFCWIDRWHGMTLEDIRALEDRVREDLGKVRRNSSNYLKGEGVPEVAQPASSVIPSQDSLIGDLLSMDINPPQMVAPAAQPAPYSGVDLLGGGLDSLFDVGPPTSGISGLGGLSTGQASAPIGGGGLLGDIFGPTEPVYVAPKTLWLPAVKGKGLEISGTFARRNGQIYMEMKFSNKAMQPMSGFAIRFNKNSFGLLPAQPLQVPSPLAPNQSVDVSLLLNSTGLVQKMKPINNLQIAVKNNVDVLYFACMVPMNVYFVEDGQMDKRVFLQTWKDIPTQNEVQYNLNNVPFSSETLVNRVNQNNIFTIAKRNVEGQDMLYQSIKLINNVWVLAEVKVPPGSNNYTLSLKSVTVDVTAGVFQVYESILGA